MAQRAGLPELREGLKLLVLVELWSYTPPIMKTVSTVKIRMCRRPSLASSTGCTSDQKRDPRSLFSDLLRMRQLVATPDDVAHQALSLAVQHEFITHFQCRQSPCTQVITGSLCLEPDPPGLT
jgi:hypothetical protein